MKNVTIYNKGENQLPAAHLQTIITKGTSAFKNYSIQPMNQQVPSYFYFHSTSVE
jgi:hypothetical protein